MINDRDFFLIISVIDGVLIYPKETRCTMVGGMCVESDKCRSLVSAKGLCPQNQYRGVECCFGREFAQIVNVDEKKLYFFILFPHFQLSRNICLVSSTEVNSI